MKATVRRERCGQTLVAGWQYLLTTTDKNGATSELTCPKYEDALEVLAAGEYKRASGDCHDPKTPTEEIWLKKVPVAE